MIRWFVALAGALALAFLATFAFTPTSVQAQGACPSYGGSPVYGSVNLAAGFTPDPHWVDVTSGGSVSLSDCGNVPSSCYGQVNGAPDYRVHISGSPSQFRFYYISDSSSRDPMLMINDANGNWHCNDDGYGGLNPQITFNNPSNGQYDIWVGHLSGSSSGNGRLYITEYSASGSVNAPASSSGGACPNYGDSPTYGETSLSASTWPDPHAVQVYSGGSVDLNNCASVPSSCYGEVNGPPDYRVRITDNPGQLRFYFVRDGGSGTDPMLMVNDASGNWHCNDDGYGNLNPQVTLNNAGSGQYDIWVGDLPGSNSSNGRLYISGFHVAAATAPEPAASDPPASASAAQAWVASQGMRVNVREGAGTQHRIITQVTDGTALEILGRSADAQWLFVRIPGRLQGWVTASMIYSSRDARDYNVYPAAGSTAQTTTTTNAESGSNWYRGSLQVDCRPDGRIWFEGMITNNGAPVNGAQIVFKSRLVPGTTPVTPPATSGPHGQHSNQAAGYYHHIVDANSAQANGKHLEIWVQDSSGNRISDHVNWDTDGSAGSCNRATINFFMP